MMSEKAERILHIILIILTIFLIGVQVGINRGRVMEQEMIRENQIQIENIY